MDGAPIAKSCVWRGQKYSATRFEIIKWLEKELPTLNGSVVDIGAGGWDVPRKLLNSKTTTYKTFDQKIYGASKNKVDVYGDIQNMPAQWSNYWDNALCLEVIECVQNPFAALDEIYRILKPGGILLLSAPYNYRAFHQGTWKDPKQGAQDYWRFTKMGLELLAKKFSKADVVGFGGTGPHDRFGHCLKAVK